jgi:hypothetical protein
MLERIADDIFAWGKWMRVILGEAISSIKGV